MPVSPRPHTLASRRAGPPSSGSSLLHAALDAAHTPPGRQRHLHRLGHVSHVRNHAHPRVQAAACVGEEGAPPTQDRPLRWACARGEGLWLPVASVTLPVALPLPTLAH